MSPIDRWLHRRCFMIVLTRFIHIVRALIAFSRTEKFWGVMLPAEEIATLLAA